MLNPIAFRKAKIVYNFGLSECSRVIIKCKMQISIRDLAKGVTVRQIRYLIGGLHQNCLTEEFLF